MQWRSVRVVFDPKRDILSRSAFLSWVAELFCKPSIEALMQREYEESRRNLLHCQRMRDYYENMVRFETQRIKSLTQTMQDETGA